MTDNQGGRTASAPREKTTTGRAAKALDVTIPSIQTWCNTGELPCKKTPGGTRILFKDDVIDFARRWDMAIDEDEL